MGLILDTIRSTSSISDANEHWETLFCLCESKGVANGISPAKNPKPADGTTSHPTPCAGNNPSYQEHV